VGTQVGDGGSGVSVGVGDGVAVGVAVVVGVAVGLGVRLGVNVQVAGGIGVRVGRPKATETLRAALPPERNGTDSPAASALKSGKKMISTSDATRKIDINRPAPQSHTGKILCCPRTGAD
jgi:hypothetical protein